MPQNHDLLHIATRAADLAAAFIRRVPRPRDPASWDRKAPRDFVTEVDREAERLIAEALLKAVPDSVVVGEELTPHAVPADVQWIVDPLDGTTNYLHDYPAYAVSIAAAVSGELEAGVVVDVVRDVTYSAARGRGAAVDGRPIVVSTEAVLANALIGTGFPFKQPALSSLDTYLRQFARVLRATSGIRRAGSAALDLAHVAEGRFDGFWELWLAPWDVAAGTLLVREAGGVVTDLAGQPAGVGAGPIVAGNPRIHELLREILQTS
ncbi:MAG TPA: inositol monophosphatase family protein [Gemmatimonadales bacterium]